jgi:hypothetical protein
MRSSLLESAVVREFQATEAYSSLDLIKAKYSISRLSMVEMENVIVGISPSEKNKIDMTMKMKFAIDMHTQILNTICSQCKRISKSVLIIQNVHFPGKRNDSNFTENRLHKICQTLIMFTIDI